MRKKIIFNSEEIKKIQKFIFEKDFHALLNILIGKSQKILEIGCGIGDYLERTNESQQVVAVEPHKPYLEKAKERCPWVTFHNSEGLAFLKDTSEEFDLILMIDVIEHLVEDDAVEMVKIAQQKADLIFSQIPIGFHEQSHDIWEMGGEYWQTHRSTWTEKNINKFGFDFIQVWRDWYQWNENEPDKSLDTSIAIHGIKKITDFKKAGIIVCKEEHPDNFLKLIENISKDDYPNKHVFILFDDMSEKDKSRIHAYENSNLKIKLIKYDSSWSDEKLNEFLKNNIETERNYWIEGKNLYKRIDYIPFIRMRKDESLLYYENYEIESEKMVALPKFIGITLTNKCNYKCFFCNRGSNEKYGTIELENFYALKPLIQNAEIINLTGWGEPLSYKNFKEVVNFIHKHNSGNCISLSSNGSLLSDEYARLLSQNLNQLIISINAASKETYERDMLNGKWEKLLHNIKNARKYIPRDKIHFTFVGHKDNIHEFPEFVKLASELDVWMVELLHLQVTRKEDLKKSLWFIKEETNKYISEAIKLGEELNIKVQARYFDSDYENSINKFKCTAPFDQVYISEKGNVAPCCYSGTQSMGNISFSEGFANVWNNLKYKKLREERYFPECDSCGNANNLNNLTSNINVLLQNDPDLYSELPLVSIVVPTYNQAEWVGKTLDSIIAQSYPVWEAIVVNDGSTDNTVNVVTSYVKKDKRIRLINKENGGISSALNCGIDHARGKYFCWLSSDDLFYPDKLELQIKQFEKLDSSYAIVFGAFDLTDPDDNVKELTIEKPFIDGYEFPRFLQYDYIDGCTIMIPMEIMKANKGFNPQFKHAQDTEFWFRLASQDYRFYFIPKKLTLRRVHPKQGFSDFQMDCRYDGYWFINFYLKNYSFRDFFKHVDFNNKTQLWQFIRFFFNLLANPDHLVNHPTLHEQFWTWFKDGLLTLPLPIRSQIINVGIKAFNDAKNQGKWWVSVYKKLKQIHSEVNHNRVQPYTKTTSKNILKYNRSGDRFFAEKIFQHGQYSLEHEHDFLSALYAFKYLSDQKNPFYREANHFFIELTNQYRYFDNYIKSFRRKPDVRTFPDFVKVFYLWCVRQTDRDMDDVVSIIHAIEDTELQEKVKAWFKAENRRQLAYSSIVYWNYMADNKGIIHDVTMKCPECGQESKHHFIIRPRKDPGNVEILCPHCYQNEQLSEKILPEYFQNKIFHQKKSENKTILPRHVYFVLRYTNIIGGGVKKVFQFIDWLDQLGCQITIYSDADRPTWCKLPGKFHRVNDHYDDQFDDADLVVVFSIYDVPKIIDKVPVERIVHLCQGYEGYHMGNSFQEMRKDKYFYTALHSLPVRNILVSNHLVDLFSSKFGREGYYIPNGINLVNFKPKPISQKQDYSIIFIGNPYDKLKGFKFLIDSIAYLQNSKQQLPSVYLKIIWGGENKNLPEEIKQVPGLSIQYFTNLTSPEVVKHLQNSMLLVNTSWYEGFSLPVLEAMACGTPVITTNNMGAESFCRDGVNSFIVRYGNILQMSTLIGTVLRKENNLSQIIQNGLDTAHEYGMHNSVKHFFNVFEELLGTTFLDIDKKRLLERYETVPNKSPDISADLPKNRSLQQDHRDELELANRYIEQEDIDKAAPIYQKVFRENPLSQEAMYGLSLVDYVRGSYSESLARLKRLLELNPSYVKAYNLLGMICYVTRKHDQAERFFKKTIELDPGNIDAHQNLAETLFAQRKFPEAKQKLSRNVEKFPDQINSFIRLAQLYIGQGFSEKAVLLLEKALKIEPDNHAVKDMLMTLQQNVGAQAP